MLGDARAPSIAGESDETRGRRREDEREAAVAAALAPNDPASIINQAERDMSRSSRAFGRRMAREEGASQFREQRQSFKDTLSEASLKDSQKPPGGSSATEKAEPSSPKAGQDAKADSGKLGSHSPTKPDESGQSSGKAGKAEPAGRSGDTDASRPRAMTPTGASAAAPATSSNGHRSSVNITQLTQARVVRSIGAASSGANGGGSRSSGAGAKPGAVSAGVADKPRGSFRLNATNAAKARGAASSQSADRQAGIDRIVRIVRSSINAKHSHSVMRIDPPDLGSLRLQIDLRGEALALRIDTSTDVAHRLLLEDVEKLRAGLEASGVRLERIEVRPPEPPADEQAVSHDRESEGEQDRGSTEANAEHSQQHGTESFPAEPKDGAAREDHSEPAAESLVNVIA